MSHSVHKGRGASLSPAGRFAVRETEPVGDPDSDSTRPQTELKPMQARNIISSNNSPDIPFERSINPYIGCEHGCVYCYARPAHAYLDLSPGLDFETRIFYKPNAVERLLASWQRPGYVCKPITIGANTDPYQPAEKKLRITRALLEAFVEYRHPVSIISKGVLMQRDLDLLGELASRRLCSVAVSIPTANDDLKRVLEPRVPSAAARFSLLGQLKDASIPSNLLLAPVIPALNDHEIEFIVANAAAAGAGHAAYILLRLPHELKKIFTDWLATHVPDRAARVMSLLRQASGGRDYDNRFGIRQTGSGPYPEMLGQRFRKACRDNEIAHGAREHSQFLDCSQFRAPGQRQYSLALDTPAG